MGELLECHRLGLPVTYWRINLSQFFFYHLGGVSGHLSDLSSVLRSTGHPQRTHVWSGSKFGHPWHTDSLASTWSAGKYGDTGAASPALLPAVFACGCCVTDLLATEPPQLVQPPVEKGMGYLYGDILLHKVPLKEKETGLFVVGQTGSQQKLVDLLK